MPEITFIIDDESGQLTVEGLDESDLEEWAGRATTINCAKPGPMVGVHLESDGGPIKVHKIWHQSVVDGPGVRSVLQVKGCPIRCAGCYVPETHDDAGATRMSASAILDELTDPSYIRDGVTILGGEPLAQAGALLSVLLPLLRRKVHVLVYTGFRVESVARWGTDEQRALLRRADTVIDGPYVRAKALGAGEYRGSSNQRMLSGLEVTSLMRKARQ